MLAMQFSGYIYGAQSVGIDTFSNSSLFVYVDYTTLIIGEQCIPIFKLMK
jgi:hypothetical protein